MLKKNLWLLFLTVAVLPGVALAQNADPNLGIIPAPVSLKKNTGTFTLSRETTILADTVTNKAVAFLADYLLNKEMLKVPVKANNGGSAPNSIVLTSIGTDDLPA